MPLRRFLPFLLLMTISLVSAPPIDAAPPNIGGCDVFPANNPWNTDISTAPVHPLSSTYIANINANGGDNLHPDFAEQIPDSGIPWTTVDSTQPLVPINFEYDEESEPGPYPIPSDAPIEGGSDNHVLVVNTSDCILYELFAASFENGVWNAGSGAVFDLNSNALRPDGWTSADAAGLPILPGLAHCDEVEAGAINHAVRFTVSRTQRAYVYPATHFASSITDKSYPPMGLRMRLKASYDISGFNGQARVILEGLKKYGMILADNGSNWFITGETNPTCWKDDELNPLKSVPGTAFEVVMSPPPPSNVSGNLLINGDFEGGDAARLPLGWTTTKPKDDKLICNYVNAVDPSQNIQVAHTGRCAFEFKGKANKAFVMQQKVKSAPNTPAGTVFTINAQLAAQNLPLNSARFRVKVKYSGGKVKKFLGVINGGTYNYTPFNHTFTVNKQVKKMNFQISFAAQSGKLQLDALSLTSSGAASQ